MLRIRSIFILFHGYCYGKSLTRCCWERTQVEDIRSVESFIRPLVMVNVFYSISAVVQYNAIVDLGQPR